MKLSQQERRKMQQPSKKFEPEVPVYHGKFKDALAEIRKVLGSYQHSLSILQKEDNGVTTSLEVTITLRK
jgi:hypothetical protein